MVAKWNRAVVHYALRVLILLGLGYYILYLWKTDQLVYYIAPRMSGLVFWAGVALVLLATYQFYRLVGHWLEVPESGGAPAADDVMDCGCGERHECGHVAPASDDHDHDHVDVRKKLDWRQVLGYTLLLIPLVVAVALPEAVLSSEITAKKGMNLTTNVSVEAKKAAAELEAEMAEQRKKVAAENAGQLEVVDENTKAIAPSGTEQVVFGGENGVPEFVSLNDFDRDFAQFAAQIFPQSVIRIEEEKFLEYLTAIDLFLPQFIGKKVEISGFVYRDEQMTKEQFVVGRLAIQCCSADAAPYGLMAVYEDAKRLTDHSWVRVTGVVEKAMHQGYEILTLRVVDAVSIPEPKQQYVYPNNDFLE